MGDWGDPYVRIREVCGFGLTASYGVQHGRFLKGLYT